CNDPPNEEDANLLRIIDLFGISRIMAPPGQGDVEPPQEPYAIVTSAYRLANAMHGSRGPRNALPPWIKQASSVYVYGLQRNNRSRVLLEALTADPQSNITVLQNTRSTMSITPDFREMCGPMSGMCVRVSALTPGIVCEVGSNVAGFQSIIRTDQGEIFFS